MLLECTRGLTLREAECDPDVIPPRKTGLVSEPGQKEVRPAVNGPPGPHVTFGGKMQRGMRGATQRPRVCLGGSRPAAPVRQARAGQVPPAAWTPAGRNLETSLTESRPSPSYPVPQITRFKTIL